jgi:hypothetical protein
MASVTVNLVKPDKGQTVTYETELLRATPGYVFLRAQWTRGRLDLGYTTFETGDVFLEHFYADRWYNVFELRSAAGALKGWYCNVTRPAELHPDTVTSVDLALDLFVSADRETLLRLDEDEFEALGLRESDPATYEAGYRALAELEAMALRGVAPFDVW